MNINFDQYRGLSQSYYKNNRVDVSKVQYEDSETLIELLNSIKSKVKETEEK